MHVLQIKKPKIRGLYQNMNRSLRQMNPQICLIFSWRNGVWYESTAKTESNPRVKMRTKILTRRSQRPKRGMNEENISESQETSSMFNDLSEIEAWISFAAHVKRQGPGFSASCTQTLGRAILLRLRNFMKARFKVM